MDIKVKDGYLQIDISDLLTRIDQKTMDEFLLNISCNDAVIKYVTQQIINKWTEEGYSGGHTITASATPLFGLDWAWREVAKHSNIVAKREIERLEKSLQEINDNYWNLMKERSERR